MAAERARALGVDVVQGLPAAIDEVAARADERHHFLRRAWFEPWAVSRASTLIARRGGAPVAALPLVGVGPRALGMRAVPGSYWPFRSFPIAQDVDDVEMDALLSAPAVRRGLGRAWRLGPVAFDDPTLRRLLPAARRSGWTVLQRETGTSYVLEVGEARKAGPWPRPSSLRNMQKHEKRLAKAGPLTWRYVAGPDWSPGLFEDLARIERNSWVGSRSGADAKFLDPARRAAWQRAAQDPVIAAMLSAGILYVGGEPAAFSFGVNCGRTRFSIATSYDRRFAKHSPGTVTGYRTYMEAVQRGVLTIDLGTGDGGEKSGMGAVPGAAVVDFLFVRNPVLAALARRFWKA
jgi:CelD/BcsL family acetyltransferase involved in cellulose biosynthesis